VRAQLQLEHIAEEPRINAWREAYRAFGAKPSEFRSSVEAMARRALRGDPLPSINALVDIGNVISLKYLVPAGGHAIDLLTDDIELRFATGQETFVPFGAPDSDVEHPLAGEIVFVEGDVVLTRRWTWRQANHTLTLPETRAIEFNVDGLPPVTRREIQDACAEVAELIQRCGGNDLREVIVATNPSVEGETTAIYLAKLIRPLGVRTSRIATGVPMGGELEYADRLTLARAIDGRREL